MGANAVILKELVVFLLNPRLIFRRSWTEQLEIEADSGSTRKPVWDLDRGGDIWELKIR